MKSHFPRPAIVAALMISLIGCTKEGDENHDEETTHDPAAEASNVVYLEEHKIFHAGIRTELVQKRSEPVPLELSGRVELDETRLAEISAPVTGRIDKVNVVANDRVEAGTVLLELFSQEFLSMQSEFIQAIERRSRTTGAIEEERSSAMAIYSAAKNKLIVVGLQEEEIAELERTRNSLTHFHVRAPFNGTLIENKSKRGSYVQVGTELFELADLTSLWVLVDLYEKDLPMIKAGMTAEVRVASSTESVRGSISTIYGVMDERTRTVKARVHVNNAKGILKPEMFATVSVQSRLDAATIKIAASALLGEPRKHYVFVALNDSTFVKRDVLTGFEGRDFIEVLDGLLVNERLVTRGGFFLKSELAKETFGEEH